MPSVPTFPSQLLQTQQEFRPQQNVNTALPSVPAQALPNRTAPHAPQVPEVSPTLTIPEELLRTRTGTSVVEEGSILDASGRTYHSYKEGKYFLPNDTAEQDRLDFQHAAIALLLNNRLAWAPMTNVPNYVMDVATGTGIWAIDFADLNPTSYVVGTDLSKIQPPNAPLNCEFLQEDSEEDWVYPLYKFDYIHLRMVYTCFDDPRKVIRQAFENMNPGGWIEFQDSSIMLFSGTGKIAGTGLEHWSNGILHGAAAKGRDILVSQHYKRWLIEAGFVDVVEHKLVWPIGTWPEDPRMKECGKYNATNLQEGARAVGLKMLSAAGLEAEEIEDIVRRVKREATDESLQPYGHL
ncbi:S-adenosyl-L-methionine-dependent methyltransferase [Pseudomassariella vexata]|uniref:S-adenosyl-L-methionine-dependent methyltransferase n=1 Tax=Pseudomassariella vexata TaxID=1141098 RepID=A0A1Y2EI88_9PEZI|nr:S-adenosyl-L-methionine-dependent methyltransferase [Pseudomassariella vexata]ORY71014.1 S-adenosyl-L-methionine-dependent methyltransferase [Pseudomassariella vexata]